jgi:hypothetical protein
MNKRTGCTATNRVLPTAALATLWLAGAGGGWAADAPAATTNAPAAADAVVLVDATMPWQHLHLEGPSYLLLAGGSNTPANFASDWKLPAEPPSVSTGSGTLVKVGFEIVEGKPQPTLWPSERTASLPPSDWAGPSFDDSAWPRLYWPQLERLAARVLGGDAQPCARRGASGWRSRA